jgi:hypothetical protein
MIPVETVPGMRRRGKRNPCTMLMGYKLIQTLWKTVWRLLIKLEPDLPCYPPTLLLGRYPKEFESGYNKVTCISMFIAAVFTIVSY